MTPMLLVLPWLVAAPVPRDFQPVKSDAEAILGRWEIIESVTHNKPNPGGIGIYYEFQKDGTCVIIHQDKSRHPIKFSIDPKTKPKSYKWVCPWGVWHGAYELDKDRLKMAAIGGMNPSTPKEVGPGVDVEYSVLRRVKD